MLKMREVVLCPKCKCFITAYTNKCVCGFNPCDEAGMIKPEYENLVWREKK